MGDKIEASCPDGRGYVQPLLAAVVPRFPFRSPDVVDVLERVCGEVGYPAPIRVDRGSEFISRELDLGAYMNGVTLDFSRPGKLTDNAFIETFNGKFRAECLNAHWFMSLDDAVRKCEAWRRDYNEVRSRSDISNKPLISSCSHQWQMARPDDEALEEALQGGPETGGSATTAGLWFELDESWGSRHGKQHGWHSR